MLTDYFEGIIRILILSTIVFLIIAASIIVVFGFYEIIQDEEIKEYIKQMLIAIAIGAGVIFLIAFIQIARDYIQIARHLKR